MTRQLITVAADFFAELEANNTRDFWQANRQRYEQEIRPTFEAILDAIGGFSSWRIYRPQNDTRFQRDKGPYKTFIGAVAERADGVGAFLQLSTRGLLLGTGLPMPAPDQLPKLRAAIAEEPSGGAFSTAIAVVRASGAIVHGGRWDALKRVPKPYRADHPRAEYLCWKGVEVNYRFQQVDWGDAGEAGERLTALIAQAEPLHRWLAANVGPSTMTAEERFAPKRK